MGTDFAAFNLPNREPDESIPHVTVTASTEEWAALVSAAVASIDSSSFGESFMGNLLSVLNKVASANIKMGKGLDRE